MVAVGSAESQQAALDKTENFDVPMPGSLPPSEAATAPSATGISRSRAVRVRRVLCQAAQTAKRHPDFTPGYEAIAAAARRWPPPRSPAACGAES
jgi:hypothetical protein